MLSKKLLDLQRYGEPRVGFMTYFSNMSGWYANITMNTIITGGSFEIKSTLYHTSPENAVDELIARVNEAVGNISKQIAKQ